MSKTIKSGLKKAGLGVELIGKTFDVPPGVLGKTAHISLTSNREAVVDGCRGVIEYCDDRIKLNIGSGTALFLGRNLCITSLSVAGAVITGYITSLEFC